MEKPSLENSNQQTNNFSTTLLFVVFSQITTLDCLKILLKLYDSLQSNQYP